MIDRQTLEMTLLQIACQNCEPLDRHTLYTIRTSVAQTLQAKERHRQRMTAADFKWQKPARRRLSSPKG
ncbi:hypothetical protein [Mixta mediterraneensis]|uniref:hypothetical protein n=1 Tax=Mixta mediterraneensis TaxID=2758443 RepID=UPI00187696C0|nr:hypothetical protein [Mixta mediterraneensis]MBE5252215.1 hypothetical protein [Mixta mediterraneensis]